MRQLPHGNHDFSRRGSQLGCSELASTFSICAVLPITATGLRTSCAISARRLAWARRPSFSCCRRFPAYAWYRQILCTHGDLFLQPASCFLDRIGHRIELRRKLSDLAATWFYRVRGKFPCEIRAAASVSLATGLSTSRCNVNASTSRTHNAAAPPPILLQESHVAAAAHQDRATSRHTNPPQATQPHRPNIVYP